MSVSINREPYHCCTHQSKEKAKKNLATKLSIYINLPKLASEINIIMENKLWIGLIVVLIGFVMVGESSFLEGANDGGIEYEMMENLEEAASLAAQLGGKGICCSGSNCIGGVCKKNCKDLGQECGIFGKGIPFAY